MEFLNSFLPILLYTCGIVLLVILIILGIKMMGILDKTDKLLDNVDDVIENVNDKVNSFNGAFQTITKVSNGIASFSDSFMGRLGSMYSKVFKKKKKEEKDYYE